MWPFVRTYFAIKLNFSFGFHMAQNMMFMWSIEYEIVSSVIVTYGEPKNVWSNAYGVWCVWMCNCEHFLWSANMWSLGRLGSAFSLRCLRNQNRVSGHTSTCIWMSLETDRMTHKSYKVLTDRQEALHQARQIYLIWSALLHSHHHLCSGVWIHQKNQKNFKIQFNRTGR